MQIFFYQIFSQIFSNQIFLTFHFSLFTPAVPFSLSLLHSHIPHSPYCPQSQTTFSLSRPRPNSHTRCSTKSSFAAPFPVSITRSRTCRPTNTSTPRAPPRPAGRRRSGRAAPALARVRFAGGEGPDAQADESHAAIKHFQNCLSSRVSSSSVCFARIHMNILSQLCMNCPLFVEHIYWPTRRTRLDDASHGRRIRRRRTVAVPGRHSGATAELAF